MADPNLPPEFYQGMGWLPPTVPDVTPSSPAWSGLPPSIPHAMGWAPPPIAPDGTTPDGTSALPPPPEPSTTLPSMEHRDAAAAQAPSAAPPEYHIPVSEFGGVSPPPSPAPAQTPRAAPASPQHAAPQTFGQQMGELRQREAGTEQAQIGAIQAGVDAQRQLHADQVSAFDEARKKVEANQQARQAEADEWKKIYAGNQAKVTADREQIDSWKFNRNKFMDELGVGGKVRWGIAQILAGIGQGLMKQAGPNPVTEMLQQNIHDANEAQYKARDALVQKLGFDRQTGQDAATYHATRQAEIDKADGLAYTALAKQLEEAAAKSADPIAQANGLKEAANVRAMGDERLKSYIQMQSEHDQRQQQIGIAGGELALNRARFGLEQKKFDWEKDKEKQQLDINAAKLLQQKNGKLDEKQAEHALYIPDPAGTGELVVARRKDGTPVYSPAPEKDQNMIGAAASYNRLVNQMIRGIRDHGGESDYIKSADWQKMQSDLEAAVAELHDAYGITSFREPTVKFFEKMVSAGVDPTSFVRDATAALRRSDENLQHKVNERVGARGYDGPQFGWQDTSAPAEPTRTDTDRALSDALVDPRRGFSGRPGKLAVELGLPPAPAPTESASSGIQLMGLQQQQVNKRLKEEGGVLPAVRQYMNTWAAGLQSDDLTIRKQSYEKLDKIAQESESAETAALAKELLDRAQQQQIESAMRTTEPVTTATRPLLPGGK